MTSPSMRPSARKSSAGGSQGRAGRDGKSISKPSWPHATVNTPLQVWKRTGQASCPRRASTKADARVACPQRSSSTSGVNQRKSKSPSGRGTTKAVSLCLFSAAIFCIVLSARKAARMHTPAGLPAKRISCECINVVVRNGHVVFLYARESLTYSGSRFFKIRHPPRRLYLVWSEDHSSAGLSIHDDGDRRCKMEMTDAALFLHGGLRTEPLPVYKALPCIRIDGEIADLKCRQVLEKMAPLGWCHAKIAESCLHDYAGS